MISKNQKWGLLQAVDRREVKDIPEPNLLREQFPYSQVPLIAFDGTSVPMDPAQEFIITDTTFRDGQQARPPYTPAQKIGRASCRERV